MNDVQEDRPTTKLSYAQMARKARKPVVKVAMNEEEEHNKKNDSAPLVSNNKEQKKKDNTATVITNKAQSSVSLPRKCIQSSSST